MKRLPGPFCDAFLRGHYSSGSFRCYRTHATAFAVGTPFRVLSGRIYRPNGGGITAVLVHTAQWNLYARRSYGTTNEPKRNEKDYKRKEKREGLGSSLYSFFSFMSKKNRFRRARPSWRYSSSQGFRCYRLLPSCDCRDFEAASPQGLPTAQELYDELVTFVERGQFHPPPPTPSTPSPPSSTSFSCKVKVEASSSSSGSTSKEKSKVETFKKQVHHPAENTLEAHLRKKNEKEALFRGGQDVASPSSPASETLSDTQRMEDGESEEKAFASFAVREVEKQKVVHRTFFDLTYRCGAVGQCACRRRTRRREEAGPSSSHGCSSALATTASSSSPLPRCRFPFCYTMRPISKGAEVWQGRQLIEEPVMSAWWWQQAIRNQEEKMPSGGLHAKKDDDDENRKDHREGSSSTKDKGNSFSPGNLEHENGAAFSCIEDVWKHTKELEKIASMAGLSFQHFSNALVVGHVLQLQPSPLLFPSNLSTREKASANASSGGNSSSSSYSLSNHKAMSNVIDSLERWIRTAVSVYVPSYSKEDEQDYFHTRSIVLRAAQRERLAGKVEDAVFPGKTLRSEQLYHIPRRSVSPSPTTAPSEHHRNCTPPASSSLFSSPATPSVEESKRSTWAEEVARLSHWRAALLVNQGRDEEAVRSLMYLAQKLLHLAGRSTPLLPRPSLAKRCEWERGEPHRAQGTSRAGRTGRGDDSVGSCTKSSDSVSPHPHAASVGPLSKSEPSSPSSPPPSVDPLLLRNLCEAAIHWAVLNDMEIITYRSITKQFVPSPPSESDAKYVFPLGNFFAHDRPLLLSLAFSEVEKIEEWGVTLPFSEKDGNNIPHLSPSSAEHALRSPLYQLLEHCAELVLQKEIVVQVSRLQLASHRNKVEEEEDTPEIAISTDSGGLLEKGSSGPETRQDIEKKTVESEETKGTTEKRILQNSNGASPSSSPLWFQQWWKENRGRRKGDVRRKNSSGAYNNTSKGNKNLKEDYPDNDESESEIFEEHPFHSLCVPLTLSYYRFYVHPRFWKHFFSLLCLPPLPSSSSAPANTHLPILAKEKVFPTNVLDAVGRSILLYHLIIFAEARSSADLQSNAGSSYGTNLAGTSHSQHPWFSEVLNETELGIAKDALRALMNLIEGHEKQNNNE